MGFYAVQSKSEDFCDQESLEHREPACWIRESVWFSLNKSCVRSTPELCRVCAKQSWDVWRVGRCLDTSMNHTHTHAPTHTHNNTLKKHKKYTTCRRKHTHTQRHTHTHTHTHTNASTDNTHTHTVKYKTFTEKYRHTHTHTHTHIHTHTHGQTQNKQTTHSHTGAENTHSYKWNSIACGHALLKNKQKYISTQAYDQVNVSTAQSLLHTESYIV